MAKDYVRDVERIGRAHVDADLEPQWYIGGYALVAEELIRAVIAKRAKGSVQPAPSPTPSWPTAWSALTKAVFLDMELAISSYLSLLEEEREALEAERDAAEQRQAQAVKAVGEALSRLAAGDLSARVEGDLAPEFQSLKTDFEQGRRALGRGHARRRAFGLAASAPARTTSPATPRTCRSAPSSRPRRWNRRPPPSKS
jgi:methyl-accepting chemotaxis protein